MSSVVAVWFASIMLGVWGRGAWVFAGVLVTILMTVRWTPFQADSLIHWGQLLVLAVTPIGVFWGKKNQLRTVRALQAKEANSMRQLGEAERHVEAMLAAAAKLESQIDQVTDVYDVTKMTSQSMSSEDLCRRFLAIALSRLPAQSVRWIEWDPPRAMGVSRGASGDLDFEDLKERDMNLIQQARAFSAEFKTGAYWSLEDPVCVWALLSCDDRPFGVLAAEGLAKKYEAMFLSMVNQLSLQLARVTLYQRLESMATIDSLTGVFVRRHFMKLAQKECERAVRNDLPCSLVMIDLDHFKSKNDTYGHLVGDVILREVSQLLQRNLREIDLIGRYGGEELVLMFVETDLEQALPVAERLRQMVEIHAIQAYDELLSQTISMGITELRSDDTLDTFITRADKALLKAKEKGRNIIVTA